jgi:WD40 repeat protein
MRLWDLERGVNVWVNYHVYDAKVWSMALSPNGKTIASGCDDDKVRLWNVETREVFAEWTGHGHVVSALCWSGNGEQVLSGSWDGTARVWNVKTGETVLTIETGHRHVFAVIYSPDATKIATGGFDENGVKIWDAKTGELVDTLKHLIQVWSLAWTSDGKKLFSGSHGSIGIFDTTTWQQAAVLEGHTHLVYAITLSQNQRFLASASADNTTRLWNLDTNLQVGPLLQHEDFVRCAALSADGTVLVTGCQDSKLYTWDIHAILKEAGLEELLPIGTNIVNINMYNLCSLNQILLLKALLEQKASQPGSGIERTPRSSLSDQSFLPVRDLCAIFRAR